MAKTKKPDCYKCKHRRELRGDCHSSCAHPSGAGDNPYGRVMATFASVGRVRPVKSETAAGLKVVGHPHGIQNGWFNWPWNFDPVWLESCDGFEPKTSLDGAANDR